ncbi:divalent-cation tolerance protein CutA [Lentzea albidocapillata]|nr:divalent cation tolerance protein CutA [Lentzea albidocapillata]
MSDYLQITTVADSQEVAVRLARSAVAARLAASAQVVGPATSIYWHLGELGTGQEWQAVLKTTASRWPALRAHLLSEHPWDNPEVTAVEIVDAPEAYFDWLKRTVAPAD